METATITVKEVKPHEGNRPYKLVDGNNTEYATFKEDIIAPARDLIGQSAEITFTEKHVDKDGRQYTNRYLEGVKAMEPEPKPGDGSYVKATENPGTQRSIHASVALQEAVRLLSSDPAMFAMPEAQIEEKVRKVSGIFYTQIRRLSGTLTDDEIPF